MDFASLHADSCDANDVSGVNEPYTGCASFTFTPLPWMISTTPSPAAVRPPHVSLYLQTAMMARWWWNYQMSHWFRFAAMMNRQ